QEGRGSVEREKKEELGINTVNYLYLEEVKNTLPDGYIIHRFVFIAPINKQEKIKQFNEGTGAMFAIKDARKLKLVPDDEKVLDLVEKSI
ncbi:MAG: hypothetical protein NTY48_02455, partial [Candidatus Diapherotrites archaeon]|nr:hypothetical protein [Candidatus Diapherotrites archaeon]